MEMAESEGRNECKEKVMGSNLGAGKDFSPRNLN